ncbi:MAG: hypothetical protein ACOVSW_10190 [Candidatus Kapaibacteriota bacterium]
MVIFSFSASRVYSSPVSIIFCVFHLARDLRAQFATQGTFVVNIISSPGSGKNGHFQDVVRRNTSD